MSKCKGGIAVWPSRVRGVWYRGRTSYNTTTPFPHLCRYVVCHLVICIHCTATYKAVGPWSIPSGTLRQKPTTEASLDRLFLEGRATGEGKRETDSSKRIYIAFTQLHAVCLHMRD